MQQSRVVGQRPVSEGHLWTLATKNHSDCNGSWVTYSRRGETFYNLKFQKSEKSVTSRLWILHYLVVNFPPSFIPWRRTMVWIISRKTHLFPLDATLIGKKPLTFCSPGVQDSQQCPDRRDSRILRFVEAGKKSHVLRWWHSSNSVIRGVKKTLLSTQ